MKLCTVPWQCSQLLVLVPIPKADKDCSLQYFHHRQKHLTLTTDTKQIRTPQHYTHILSQFLHAHSCTESDPDKLDFGHETKLSVTQTHHTEVAM